VIAHVNKAVEAATGAGASYAEARVERRRRHSVAVKNGSVDALTDATELGLGIRVIADGAWGFAASARLDADDVEKTARLAVRIARASARLAKEPVELGPAQPVKDEWSSRFRIDPFEVPLEEKIRVLMAADGAMRRNPEVKVAEGRLNFFLSEKWFASSEGAQISQRSVSSGGLFQATAVRGSEVQVRSFPSSLEGFHAAAGYEVIEEMGIEEGVARAASEACDLLDAPPCPPDVTTLILDGSQMALQVHESCGHPTELDRVFGTERSYAGTSFLTPDKVGKFRYGSELVSIAADATVPGALGSFGYDDEGVPAQRVPLVEKGVFVGYLSSRETAARLGKRSGGAMRADGWNRIPLIRMTNINLDPGEHTLTQMIEETERGVFASTTKSWSIDDLRLNFQFATEIAWEIRRGKLGQRFKNFTYQGVTPEFWGSCDAIGNRQEWKMWGVLNCGKGEPCQVMHVGHGTAPARFRRVRVGVEAGG
jgi:TldD protein